MKDHVDEESKYEEMNNLTHKPVAVVKHIFQSFLLNSVN